MKHGRWQTNMTQDEFDKLSDAEKTCVLLEEGIKGVLLTHDIKITLGERARIVAETLPTEEAHKILQHMSRQGLDRGFIIPLAIIANLLATLSVDTEDEGFETWARVCIEQARIIRRRQKGSIQTIKVVMPPPGEGTWN